MSTSAPFLPTAITMVGYTPGDRCPPSATVKFLSILPCFTQLVSNLLALRPHTPDHKSYPCPLSVFSIPKYCLTVCCPWGTELLCLQSGQKLTHGRYPSTAFTRQVYLCTMMMIRLWISHARLPSTASAREQFVGGWWEK